MATIRGIKGTAFHWGRRPGEEGSMRCAGFRELETGEGETPSFNEDAPEVTLRLVRVAVSARRGHMPPGIAGMPRILRQFVYVYL